MEETVEKPLRPQAITIICVFGFLGVALSIPQFFSPKTLQIGSWYLPYLCFSVLMGMVCMLGLWKMKKWAVYTYTVFVILNQIVLYLNGLWELPALIFPVLVVLLILKYMPDMS